MTPFTQSLWDTFGGAERLPNGEPPLYGEHGQWCIIVCGSTTGSSAVECDVQVYYAGDEVYWSMTLPTLGSARMVAESLERDCSFARLKELGFEEF